MRTRGVKAPVPGASWEVLSETELEASRVSLKGRGEDGFGVLLLRSKIIACTSLSIPKPLMAMKQRGQRLSPLILQKEKHLPPAKVYSLGKHVLSGF